MTNTEPRPQPSPGAREVLRVLRMISAVPGQKVRYAMLRTLLVRHCGRHAPANLDLVIAELIDLGLLAPGIPDGVSMKEEALPPR